MSAPSGHCGHGGDAPCEGDCAAMIERQREELQRQRRRINRQANRILALQHNSTNLQLINTQATEIRTLRNQNDVLNGQLSRKKGGKYHKLTWADSLIAGLPYHRVVKLSNREENMLSAADHTHPGIRLGPPPFPDDLDLDIESIEEVDEEHEIEHDDEFMAVMSQDLDAQRRALASLVLPREFPSPVRGLIEWKDNKDEDKPFLFSHLPMDLKFKIFKMMLVQEGLLHAFSRLDPYCRPDVVNNDSTRESLLSRRFYLQTRNRPKNGRLVPERVSLHPTDGNTIDPQKLLKPLLVCREWYWYSIHIFYSQNTFAFSSIGEFGRFMSGIGRRRHERITNVELTWIGNQRITFPLYPDQKGRKRYHYSRRTTPLMWFTELHKLRSLVLHVTESGPRYARRKYEPPKIRKILERATRGKCNYSSYRALRCLQGIDYVYQLRGMKPIKIYDLQREWEGDFRPLVHDISFSLDVNRQARSPKLSRKKRASGVRQLSSLLPVVEGLGGGWLPRDRDFQVVAKLYDDEEDETDDEDESEDDGPSLDYSYDSSDDDSDDPDDDGGSGKKGKKAAADAAAPSDAIIQAGSSPVNLEHDDSSEEDEGEEDDSEEDDDENNDFAAIYRRGRGPGRDRRNNEAHDLNDVYLDFSDDDDMEVSDVEMEDFTGTQDEEGMERRSSQPLDGFQSDEDINSQSPNRSASHRRGLFGSPPPRDGRGGTWEEFSRRGETDDARERGQTEESMFVEQVPGRGFTPEDRGGQAGCKVFRSTLPSMTPSVPPEPRRPQDASRQASQSMPPPPQQRSPLARSPPADVKPNVWTNTFEDPIVIEDSDHEGEDSHETAQTDLPSAPIDVEGLSSENPQRPDSDGAGCGERGETRVHNESPTPARSSSVIDPSQVIELDGDEQGENDTNNNAAVASAQHGSPVTSPKRPRSEVEPNGDDQYNAEGDGGRSPKRVRRDGETWGWDSLHNPKA